MTLVVDASIAAKWVIKEDNSDRALALRTETDLIAPSLIVFEIGSALWKLIRRGWMREADATTALGLALDPFHALVPIEELGSRALELAIALDHPIYDCFYLALAERERAPLISADSRLLKLAARLKGVQARAL